MGDAAARGDMPAVTGDAAAKGGNHWYRGAATIGTLPPWGCCRYEGITMGDIAAVGMLLP